MSSRVKILEDTVVNQIAAGEVVERPSSVVKELVENALDAGSSEITVVIANGGKSLIEVIDNGRGMLREDALLAIERFGTSKISSVEDLEGVSTLGFRGEALPSIASVSKLTLTTRSTDSCSAAGIRLEIAAGEILSNQELDCPLGTRIEVKNLFFNVPARRKFLRSESSETGLIKALLGDFAVSHQEVRFSLVSEGAQVLLYAPVSSFEERVNQLGLVRGNLLSVESEKTAEGGTYQVSARLSHPINCVSGSGKLRLVVNGRVVRDRLVLKAVRDGFGAFLKGSKYPSGVVKLCCPAQDVDVNVHPQKTEVRFRDSQAVFSLVRGSIARALSLENPEVMADASAGGSRWASMQKDYSPYASSGHLSSTRSDYGSRKQTNSFLNSAANAAQEVISFGSSASYWDPAGEIKRQSGESLAEPEAGEDGYFSESKRHCSSFPSSYSVAACRSTQHLRYVDQVFDLYLLFQAPTEMVIVDMHAAHERVTFFRLKKQFIEGRVLSQTLLLPETINCPPERQQSFADLLRVSSRLGIEAEDFGDGSIIVRALPALLGAVSAQAIFDDLFSTIEWRGIAEHLEERLDAALARLACHGSVRSGRKLKEEEAYALLDSLAEVEASAFCPHGRPVMINLREQDLEAMFGRS